MCDKGDFIIFDECFNRYMVECECLFKPFSISGNICFNRYMVECE